MTAEEFVNQYDWENSSLDIPEVLRQFAKYHVEQALKAASEKAKLTDFAQEFLQEGASEAIDKESILRSYPLNLIE